jgi:hyaluronoglucosaminidase
MRAGLSRSRRLVAGVAIAATVAGSVLASGIPAGSAAPASTDTTSTPIKHVVTIYMENHSFDNYFGTYPHAANPPGEPAFTASPNTPQVNGLTPSLLSDNANLANPRRLDRTEQKTCDPRHTYGSLQGAYDNGNVDHFVQSDGPGGTSCDPTLPMGYYDGNTVTALWNYAQHFAMSDNHFADTYGPSNPQIVNLISGNTHGAVSTAPTPEVENGTLIGNLQPTLDDCSTNTPTLTMSGRNIGDLLNAKHVTWGWFAEGFRPTSYVDGKAVCGFTHQSLTGVNNGRGDDPFQYYRSTVNPHHLPPTSTAMIGHTDQANHQYGLSDFWAAARAGNLPAVSFVRPAEYEQGHPASSDPLDAQRFLVNTINGIERSPQWQSTAIVITWDESGGWYDHVMPPMVNDSQAASDVLTGAGECGTRPPINGYQDRCGFGPRIPEIVISPYARENYIDHARTAQSDTIHFIEDNWHLGRIGDGSFDDVSGTIAGMFDFDHPAAKPLFLDPATGEPASEPTPTSSALPQVYPTPQSMHASGSAVHLRGPVGLVVGQHTDPAAEQALAEVLRAAGSQVTTFAPGDPLPQGGTFVYLGSQQDNAAIAPVLHTLGVDGAQASTALGHSEGYVLATGRDHGEQDLVLAGADPSGTFYAVQTLRQIVHAGTAAAVTVADWPSMKIRGVIEGFYGPPWSTADRTSQFGFDGELKMNSYVYSPKDDPYLRAQWRDLYPPDELAVIKQLVDAAAANHVSFTYALSPGLSICYSSAGDVASLIAKFQSMWDIGVRSFAIPFDDIKVTQWNCTADQDAFGPPDAEDAAKAQAHVLNAVQQNFIAAHAGAAPLEFVPTEYNNTTEDAYKNGIAADLDPSVIVEWTGDATIPAEIFGSQAQAARQVFGHDILLWDNYPVNDYVANRLLMGPYNGRSSDLSQYLTGVTANPMVQEEASKLALYTAGAHFWNPIAYDRDPQAAWLAGIRTLGGKVWPALKVFADNNYSSVLNPQESPTLTPLITAFWQAWYYSSTDLSGAAARLDRYFATMAAAPGQLRSGLHNPAFLSEVEPWLTKLGRYGQAGQAAVAMLLAVRAGDAPAAVDDRSRLDTLRTQISASVQQVAPGVMDPFLVEAQHASEDSPALTLSLTSTSPTLRPDEPATVTATVTDTGSSPLHAVQVGLPAPSGWTVRPTQPAGLGDITAGHSAHASWTVTRPTGSLGSAHLVGWVSYETGGTAGALLATYQPALRGEWDFTKGSAVDISGNDHDGTAGAGVTFTSDGATFDGTAQGAITIPYGPDYQPEAITSGQTWTLNLTGVVPAKVGGAYQAVANARSYSGGRSIGWTVYIAPDGTFQFWMSQVNHPPLGSFVPAKSGVSAVVGERYDIAAQWDGTHLTINVSGAGNGSGSATADYGYLPLSNAPITFGEGGSGGNGTFFYNGKVAAASITIE